MDRVSSFLSLRGRKVPRHKFEPLTPAYRTASCPTSSASCSNNLTTSTANLLSTNIPTTANNIPHAHVTKGSLALTQTRFAVISSLQYKKIVLQKYIKCVLNGKVSKNHKNLCCYFYLRISKKSAKYC